MENKSWYVSGCPNCAPGVAQILNGQNGGGANYEKVSEKVKIH